MAVWRIWDFYSSCLDSARDDTIVSIEPVGCELIFTKIAVTVAYLILHNNCSVADCLVSQRHHYCLLNTKVFFNHCSIQTTSVFLGTAKCQRFSPLRGICSTCFSGVLVPQRWRGEIMADNSRLQTDGTSTAKSFAWLHIAVFGVWLCLC